MKNWEVIRDKIKTMNDKEIFNLALDLSCSRLFGIANTIKKCDGLSCEGCKIKWLNEEEVK